jgi:hypothetical protein
MPPAPPPQQTPTQKAQAQQQNQTPANTPAPAQQPAGGPPQLNQKALNVYAKQLARSDSRVKNRRPRVSSRRVVQGAVTVQGAILGSILGSVILLAIMVSLGPLVDFFQAWLMNQPGNPYAAPVLDMFPWIYIFIFTSWVVYIIAIWRAATQQGSYGVYD